MPLLYYWVWTCLKYRIHSKQSRGQVIVNSYSTAIGSTLQNITEAYNLPKSKHIQSSAVFPSTKTKVCLFDFFCLYWNFKKRRKKPNYFHLKDKNETPYLLSCTSLQKSFCLKIWTQVATVHSWSGTCAPLNCTVTSATLWVSCKVRLWNFTSQVPKAPCVSYTGAWQWNCLRHKRWISIYHSSHITTIYMYSKTLNPDSHRRNGYDMIGWVQTQFTKSFYH